MGVGADRIEQDKIYLIALFRGPFPNILTVPWHLIAFLDRGCVRHSLGPTDRTGERRSALLARGGKATMSTQSHYRRLAENCMRMAAECADPEIASALRIMAADYLSSADAIERPVGQQQQQIQPKEP